MLQYAVSANDAIATKPLIEARIGHLTEAFLQACTVSEFCPKPRIAAQHAIKRVNPASAIFVHHIERDADRFVFTLHDNAIAEFGMVRYLNFGIVDENAMVVDDIVREICAIRNNAVVSDIAGDYLGVEYSGSHRDVVVLEGNMLEFRNADKARKKVVAHKFGAKRVFYEEMRPVVAGIVISDKNFELVGGEGAVIGRVFAQQAELFISDPILGLVGAEILWGNETLSNFRFRKYSDFFCHVLSMEYLRALSN